MLIRMYSIYDKKVNVYQPPLFCHNAGDALRTCHMHFSNPETKVNKYPEDFDVYDIGEYDDQTGQLKPHTNPQFLSTAVDILGIKELNNV